MNARRANDTALEWLILVARVASLVYLGIALAFEMVAAFTFRPAFAFTGGLLLIVAAGIGWFGWWQFGNADWRPTRRERRGLCPCVRSSPAGPLTCNIQVDETGYHQGQHWDSIGDPERRFTWA